MCPPGSRAHTWVRPYRNMLSYFYERNLVLAVPLKTV